MISSFRPRWAYSQTVEATVDLRTPPGSLWRAITDHESLPRHVSMLREVKVIVASKSLSGFGALHGIDFSTRRKTTDHNGQANNTKEKSCRRYRSQRTNPERFRGQPRYNLRATRPSHPARSGGSDVWDLCASDRASLHQFR